MKLLENKKTIRKLYRTIKNKVFLLNQRKKVMRKWLLVYFLGRGGFLKRNFFKAKKFLLFFQRNKNKYNFIIKTLFLLGCKLSTYNLFVFVKNSQEYTSLKYDLNFSEVGFKFWNINKNVIKDLFKEHAAVEEFSAMLNGRLLSIQHLSLKSLLESFCLFTHQYSICCGVFLHGRFFWPEELFKHIFKLEANLKKFNFFFSTSCSRFLSSFFGFFFSFFGFFYNLKLHLMVDSSVPFSFVSKEV